jgi:hypothetical protein
MRASLPARAGLAAGATLLALALSECGLRTLSPEQLGFAYLDGVFDRPVEFKKDRTRNALGLHDAPIADLEDGERRLLILGDSYIHAAAVDVKETVGQQLEEQLREAGSAWDVVSIGGVGWGQIEELSALQERGPQLVPDQVLTVFLPLNDVRNNHPGLQKEATLQMARMQRFRPGWIQLAAEDAPLFLVQSSRLNQLLSHRLALWSWEEHEDEIPLDYQIYATAETPEWTEAWTMTEDLIRATRDAASQLGADYAVAIASTPQGVAGAEEGRALLSRAYPRMDDETWDLDLPSQRLMAFCESEGIPILDLEPGLRARTADGQSLHFPYDGHWNAAGHRAAAQLLAPFILASSPTTD